MNLSEIQLDADALRHNVRALRKLAGSTPVAAVVKGNAYGHGLEQVVRILEDEVDAFQVDDLDELRALRAVSDKRTLVLGYVPREGLTEAIALGGELALYDLERLPELAGAKVHLKIDALLGRQGILPRDLDQFVSELQQHLLVNVVAAYAHFANIEDTTDLEHAQAQIEVFEDAFQRLRTVYPSLGRHLSSTAALMTVESGNDLIRLGIGCYGMHPSAPLRRRHTDLNLKPVMRWVSHLAQVKTLPPQHPVGYGLTYITRRETRIGIVPQGYSDGYDRGLSSVGEVLVRGVRCTVLGRIAMNMFAIDLTDVPDAVSEDEVVLLGAQGSDRITAEEIASRLGTINYEITTRVSALLPRLLS